MFRLENFIADLPDAHDPDIQAKLTQRRELNECAPNISEVLAGRGTLYAHQKLYYRIFKNYTHSLILDRTGTGKTCEIISIAEYFKNIELSGINPLDEYPHIRKILFLVKGRDIKAELRNQLVYKCTLPGTYDTPEVYSSDRSKTTNNRITHGIREWYEIRPFESFSNALAKLTDLDVERQYSGTMIFIDEGHYLKAKSTDKSIDTQLAEEAALIHNEVDRGVAANAQHKPDVYNQIWRLTHLAKRSRVYIATATPMINDPSELASRLNLLNPRELQISHNQWNWDKVTAEQLEPYVRGMISYVRELDTGITVVNEGVLPHVEFGDLPFQTTIWPTIMSELQTQAYMSARNKRTEGKDDVKKSSFYKDELSASTFVFPNSTYGGNFAMQAIISNTGAAGKVVSSVSARGVSSYLVHGRGEEYIANPEFEAYLSDMNNLRNSSSIYYDIISRYKSGTNRGKAFVYSGDMKSGSGLYTLAACLSAQGWAQYRNNVSDLIYDASTGTRVVKPDFQKVPRFAYITGTTPEGVRNNIMELYNSADNMNGEYIQFLLGSEVTQAGINLSDVLNVELVSVEWHASGTYQALSRVLRSLSHVNLLSRVPAGQQLVVRIYRHAAVTGAQYNNLTTQVYLYGDVSADDMGTQVYAYLISEDKDIRIKRIEHILVRFSVNYYINYVRNHRTGDMDRTPICYYTTCDAPPTNPDLRIIPTTPATRWRNLSTSDTSTYDIYYTDEIVQYCTEVLRTLFLQHGTWTLNQIMQVPALADVPSRYIVITANSCIARNVMYTNTWGQACRLYCRDTTFYILPQWTDAPLDSNVWYSTHKCTTVTRPADATAARALAYARTAALWPDRAAVDAALRGYGVTQIAEVLEVAISHIYSADNDGNATTDFDVYIYNKYAYLIYVYARPDAALNAAQTISNIVRINGRKFEKEFALQLQNLDFNATSGARVVVHTVYNTDTSRGRYAESTQYQRVTGALRVYDVSTSQWYAAPLPEWMDAVYKWMCNYTIQTTLQPYNAMPILGIITYSGAFLVRDLGDGEAERDRGKNCTSYQKHELVDIAYRLGYPGEDEIKVDDVDMLTTLSKKYLSKFDKLFDVVHTDEGITSYDVDKAHYYYNMLEHKNLNLDILCGIIRARLYALGAVYDSKSADYRTPLATFHV